MTDKEKIRNIIELFIAWNGETYVIDVANIDSAVEFIANSLQEEPISEGKDIFDRQKEQMMIDACVIDTKGNYPSLTYSHIDMMFALKDMKVAEGDKVKLIIIKED